MLFADRPADLVRGIGEGSTGCQGCVPKIRQPHRSGTSSGTGSPGSGWQSAYCNIAGRWQGRIPSRSSTKLGLHRFGRGSATNFQRLLMGR